MSHALDRVKPGRVSPRLQVKKLDRLRLAEYVRRRTLGQTAVEAWRDIATDEGLGTRDFRGKTEVQAKEIASSLAKFLHRMQDPAMGDALAQCRVEAAALASEALGVVASLVRGDFAQTKVGAAVARVRHEAARTVLEAVKFVDRGRGVQVGVQVNNGRAGEYDVVEQLERDPDLHRRALDLARSVAPGPGGVRAAPEQGPMGDGAAPGPDVADGRGGGHEG